MISTLILWTIAIFLGLCIITRFSQYRIDHPDIAMVGDAVLAIFVAAIIVFF